MRIFKAVLALLTVAGLATAQLGAAENATGPGEFLKIGVGARYAAMGGAAVATADDAYALYWNPGNLTRVGGLSASYMYNSYVSSIKHHFAGMAMPLGPSNAVAASFQALSFGSIQHRDNSGTDMGEFSPNDAAADLGYAHNFGKGFSAGLSGRYVRSKIVDSADTFAAGLGLGWMRGRFTTGLALQNLGGRLQLGDRAKDLPALLQAGASYRVGQSWVWALDGTFPKEGNNSLSLGSEYGLFDTVSTILIRAGYHTRLRNEPFLGGITAGVGLRISAVMLDYAWVPMGDLGYTHQISLSLRLG